MWLAVSPVFAAVPQHSKSDIQMLNDSAAALADTKPDLSAGLKSIAARESGESEQTGKETAGVQQQDIKVLQDSADALQGTKPDLSDGLRKFADDERQHMKEPHQTQPYQTQPAPSSNTP
jgi:hypothetical protein